MSGGRVSMHLMTMSELEQASGVPRSAIHFYLREGLLPRATRTATNRALYTDAHLDLVGEVRRLRREGLRLSAIKAALKPAIDAVEVEEVDLNRQPVSVRRSIMETAARAFAAKGYTRTRVADIIRETETTPQVFYSHFATKRNLFLVCLEVFSDLAVELIEPRVAEEPDTVKHAVLRAFGNLWLRELSPAPMSLAAAEAVHEDSETAEAYYRGYDKLVATVIPDLELLRKGSRSPVPFPSDWLVATALMGVIEATVGRQAWDEQFSTRDVLLTVLLAWIGIEAVYTGRVDLGSKRQEYEEWIDDLLQRPLPVPGNISS
jgi:AcrR family transcriptional regulator